MNDETNNPQAIVKSGDLDKVLDDDARNLILDVFDAKSAKEAVDKARLIEDYLRVADECGEYATKFCILEADMYVRISNIDGAEDELDPCQRRLITWIRSLDDQSMSDVLSEVREGVRIVAIFRRETGKSKEEIEEETEREYLRISDEILEDLEREGHAELSPAVFYDRWSLRRRPNKDSVRAHCERTRDRIINGKGVGLGDGKGTYMLPEAAGRDSISKAVSTRLKSILGDLRRLRQLCDGAKFKVPHTGVEAIVEAARALE